MNTKEFKNALVSKISECSKVKAIGQTGDSNAPLIPGQSDIDLFVLCSEIPSKEERMSIYQELNSEYSELMMEVCNGGLWGYGDIMVSNGIDVMPMYFTIQEMDAYLEDVLHGNHIEREGRFYPCGRLASIETLSILYEESKEWSILKEKVKKHPKELMKKMYEYHISCVLDEEDLGRSCLRREVLFYHQVLENALDHLLIALYAVNDCYFPSRKRTQNAIEHFMKKPQNTYERLLFLIEAGSQSESIEKSVETLRKLEKEIKEIGDSTFSK